MVKVNFAIFRGSTGIVFNVAQELLSVVGDKVCVGDVSGVKVFVGVDVGVCVWVDVGGTGVFVFVGGGSVLVAVGGIEVWVEVGGRDVDVGEDWGVPHAVESNKTNINPIIWGNNLLLFIASSLVELFSLEIVWLMTIRITH